MTFSFAGTGLPVEEFLTEIVSSESPYIIIEGETGSGKSTLVPLAFREAGFTGLVTEPLRETVLGTSEYAAKLGGCEFGREIGYRMSGDKKAGRNTELLYATDGLALVRELLGQNRFDILFLDELHQWNINQSVLEAWAWERLQDGTSSFQKIVVLSATLDSDELSRKRGNAPVFKVPGRQYPIADLPAGDSVVGDIKAAVARGEDVLAFFYGKKPIEDAAMELRGTDAAVIPFHGQVDRAEKNRAYCSYDRPKVILSTNALETGRTVVPSPGRTLTVIDSGMERRVEVENGVEMEKIRVISKAQSKQRRGRTGRVGEGNYLNHVDGNQQDHPMPEILRTRPDQTVLRLKTFGYDAADLPFFHPIGQDIILDTNRSLRALGAFDEDGEVTKIGRKMARLPVSVQNARMVVEAEKRGVVGDVITIAAILEEETIRDRTENWRNLTNETESDLLAELDIWDAASDARYSDFRQMGIFAQAYRRAQQTRRKIVEAMSDLGYRQVNQSSGDADDILLSCVAGMVDHLYRHTGSGEYRNGGNDDLWTKANESVLDNCPEWAVGIPKVIHFETRRGSKFTKNLLSMMTDVDPRWLTEVAPQLVTLEEGLYPRFDADKDSCVSTTKTHFNGQLVDESEVATPDHEDAVECLADWLAGQIV